MTPVEAAVALRNAMKADPMLRQSVHAMVARSDHDDLYAWVEANPEMAIRLADQVDDIDGQIGNMQARLNRGDLS